MPDAAAFAELKRLGANEAELAALREALENSDRVAAERVSESLRKQAQKLLQREMKQRQSAFVQELADRAARAPAVEATGRARLEGDTVILQVPPHTVVLVECLWGGANGR